MGKWIEREVISSWAIPELQSAKCSECARYLTTPYRYGFKHYNRCPYCGEPMEKEKYDNAGQEKGNVC